jgi:hypothetical protein
MQKWIIGFLACALLAACNTMDDTPINKDLTGKRMTYTLEPGSTYDIHGTVVIEEKIDGTPLITVSLEGTEGNIEHPVHVHLGDISTPDAAVYANLTPIVGKVGSSATNLHYVANETAISFKDLLRLNACIKVHLSAAGPAKDVVLAGGNIGAAFTKALTSGRTGFSNCKSE